MSRRKLDLTPRAIKMLESGFVPREIRAALPGLSPSTLSSLTRKLGYRFRRGRVKQPASKRALQIIAMSRRHPGPAVAKKFGITRVRVGQILKRYAPNEKFKNFNFKTLRTK